MTSGGHDNCTSLALLAHVHELPVCYLAEVVACYFAGAVSRGERGSRQGSPRRHSAILEAHRAHGDPLHQNASKSLQRDLLPQQAIGEHCLTIMPSVDR